MKKVMEAIWGEYEPGIDTILISMGYIALVVILWIAVGNLWAS
jgi:hypothetical protein